MRTLKAVPIVLRLTPQRQEVLMFDHPLAGAQLVKGTVEPGETVAHAAVRELAEESGIEDAEFVGCLGIWPDAPPGQEWHFCQMRVARELPDHWSHFTADGGGHTFEFFWHPVQAPAPPDCHAVFRSALAYLRQLLPQPSGDELTRG